MQDTPNPIASASCSPLVLSDRLISLARDADRVGLRESAGRLIALAYSVLDDVAVQPA